MKKYFLTHLSEKGKYSKTGFKITKKARKGVIEKGDRDMSDDSEGVCSQLFKIHKKEIFKLQKVIDVA